MTTYTKLAADGTDLPADATGHQAVRVDHPLLAKPLIFTAFHSPTELNYKQAMKWAESLDVNGWAWRAPTAEESFFLPDRTKYPALDPNFFPDFSGYEWNWTSTMDAESPSEYAWLVGLGAGNSNRIHQSNRRFVRAVRAGQF
jgi:uncharacterized protein DUF1566